MSDRKSVEEIFEEWINREPPSWRDIPTPNEKNYFITGFNKGIRACIEELRTMMDQASNLNDPTTIEILNIIILGLEKRLLGEKG